MSYTFDLNTLLHTTPRPQTAIKRSRITRQTIQLPIIYTHIYQHPFALQFIPTQDNSFAGAHARYVSSRALQLYLIVPAYTLHTVSRSRRCASGRDWDSDGDDEWATRDNRHCVREPRCCGCCTFVSVKCVMKFLRILTSKLQMCDSLFMFASRAFFVCLICSLLISIYDWLA